MSAGETARATIPAPAVPVAATGALAWDWLARHADYFDPRLHPDKDPIRFKAAGELAYVIAACCMAGCEVDPMRALADGLAARLRVDAWAPLVGRNPRFVVGALVNCLFAQRSGNDASPWQALVRRIVATGALDTMPFSAYRRLETLDASATDGDGIADPRSRRCCHR